MILRRHITERLLERLTVAPVVFFFYHLRTVKGHEVDFILEDSSGRLLGVEVKASATVGTDDFRHLRAFSEWAGERWAGGIVFYLGTTQAPFGAGLWASPIQCLWRA